MKHGDAAVTTVMIFVSLASLSTSVCFRVPTMSPTGRRVKSFCANGRSDGDWVKEVALIDGSCHSGCNSSKSEHFALICDVFAGRSTNDVCEFCGLLNNY